MSIPSVKTLLWLNATLALALVCVSVARRGEANAKLGAQLVPLPLVQLNNPAARPPGATQPGTTPGAAGAAGTAAGPAPRPHGQYLMLSGRVQGANTNALYLVDTANQELVALKWNRSAARLEALGYRSLQADSGAAAVPAGGGRNSGGGGGGVR